LYMKFPAPPFRSIYCAPDVRSCVLICL